VLSEMNSRLLAIYLNDHLAGATGGLELARRASRANEGSAVGDFLAKLAAEIDEDRDSLLKLMDAVDVKPDRAKVAAGWSAEKLGRLKPNGQLRGYSPLSRLTELEGLRLGVTGKLELWKTMQRTLGDDVRTIDFEELIKRAQRQIRGLTAQHKSAAALAFEGEPK